MDKEEDEEPMYPLDAKFYRFIDEVGRGMSSIIHTAFCHVTNTRVAIKSINLDKSHADIDSILSTPELYHPLISISHCVFFAGYREVWVVMPIISAGSLQSIISYSFPTGLPEDCIKIFLKQILKLLSYLHSKRITQMELKAGNILLDLNGSIKFSDFNLWCYSQRTIDISGHPYWFSPEVVKSNDGFSKKSDVWSFGILALELAHGGPPLSGIPQSKSLTMRINERFCFGNYYQNSFDDSKKKFSKSFKKLVKKCLKVDPAKRPTLEKLRKHEFFRDCKSDGFIVHNMLQDLPSPLDRFERSKQRMVLDELDELDKSQCNVISGWNLNVENLKLFPSYSSELEETQLDRRVQFSRETIIEESLNRFPSYSSELDETRVDKRVQFRGETVIEDEEDDFYVSKELTDVSYNLNEVIELLDEVNDETPSREEFLGALFRAKRALEKQLKRVTNLITLHGGVMPEE